MSHSLLFTPTTLNDIELRNRAVVAPMTRISAKASGCVGPLMPQYYEAFGKGGFAAIVTEGVYTDKKYSQGYQYQPGITDAEQTKSWADLIKVVHATGAKVVMQLMHAGALSQYNPHVNLTCGPSAIQPKGTQMEFYRGIGTYSVPKEMDASDIKTAISGFTEAAKRAREAGADGIEVHSANGYLLDQFLTDYTNQRTDNYGLNTLGRIQLSCEVLECVREAVGRDFTIGVRVSQSKVNDFEHKWAAGERDAEIIFTALQASGADYIHTTEFDANAPAFDRGSSLAALAKKFTLLPVIANGGLGHPNLAEQMLSQSSCDFVALGKDALASPDWPNRVRNAQPRDTFEFAMFSPLANLETAQAYSASKAKGLR